MGKIINVGIVGFGMSGELFQAPFINEVKGFKLKKVLERRRERSKELYPWVEVVRSFEEILSDDEIELVVISVPNEFHFDMAKQALLSGKHVVVEKPFTVTSREANELIDIAKRENRILSVYQNRRFDSDFMTVKKVVGGDLLGRLTEYEAHFDRYTNFPSSKPWKESDKQGMGVLYDLGSHLIDQTQVLFGLPKEVTAFMGTQRDNGDNVDYFDLYLGYEGLNVKLSASMLVRELGPHFMLHGTEGSFVKYGMDPQEERLKNGMTPSNTPDLGVEPRERWGRLNTNINGIHFEGIIESLPGRYQTYYENIYNAIFCGEELLVKPEEGRNTIRIIELAIKSANEKRTVNFALTEK